MEYKYYFFIKELEERKWVDAKVEGVIALNKQEAWEKITRYDMNGVVSVKFLFEKDNIW